VKVILGRFSPAMAADLREEVAPSFLQKQQSVCKLHVCGGERGVGAAPTFL